VGIKKCKEVGAGSFISHPIHRRTPGCRPVPHTRMSAGAAARRGCRPSPPRTGARFPGTAGEVAQRRSACSSRGRRRGRPPPLRRAYHGTQAGSLVATPRAPPRGRRRGRPPPLRTRLPGVEGDEALLACSRRPTLLSLPVPPPAPILPLCHDFLARRSSSGLPVVRGWSRG
jgi:hypothetical protein